MNPPTTTRAAIAAEVRAAVAYAGITQAELSQRTGMGPGTLSSRLSGATGFGAEEIQSIGLALGIDPLTLLARPFARQGAA